MSSNVQQPQQPQQTEQPWKKWLAQEKEQTVEGDSKKPWNTWTPNAANPAEKPWLIWNGGEGPEAEGMRDDRPHNAASFSFSLKKEEK